MKRCVRLFHPVFLLLLLLLAATCAAEEPRQCGQAPYHPILFNNLVRAYGKKTYGAPGPLQIFPHYLESYRKSKHGEEFKKAAIKPAIQFWESTLSPTMSLMYPLHLHRSKDCSKKALCGTAEIPQEYMKECREENKNYETASGFNGTNYILFVDSSETECGPSIFGWGIVCQAELGYARPIAGLINICSSIMNPDVKKKHAYHAMVHEIAHALGFYYPAYAYMRDKLNKQRSPIAMHDILDGKEIVTKPDEPVMDEVTQTWKTYKKDIPSQRFQLKTPELVNVARSYYNCPALTGISMGTIENDLSHFDKRWVGDEIMSKSLEKTVVVSRLTLAYFEDSGWYRVDYSKADKLTWGAGSGCDFLEKSCYEYITTQKKLGNLFDPWCETKEHEDNLCSLTDGICCNLIRHPEPLDERYQYFNDSHFGGPDASTQYCPYKAKMEKIIVTNPPFTLHKVTTIPLTTVAPDDPAKSEPVTSSYWMLYWILLPMMVAVILAGFVIVPLLNFARVRRQGKQIREEEFIFETLAQQGRCTRI